MAKELTNLAELISKKRKEAGLSQRQLAKLSNVDNAEVSRVENGKRKKPNIIYLKGIAETLDLSLVELMKLAGYDDRDINWGRSSIENRSLEDFKKIVERYHKFYYEVLDDGYTKKEIVRHARSEMFDLIDRLENPDFYPEKITEKDILKRIKEINRNLSPASKKFDYANLPKMDPAEHQVKDDPFIIKSKSSPKYKTYSDILKDIKPE